MKLLRVLALAGLFFVHPLQAQANKLLMPGDVIKGHAKVEETCEKCHKKFEKEAQSILCSDCHKEIGKDIAAQRGYHGRLEVGKECNDCHTDHKGRNARIIVMDKAKFDHTKTDYPLKDGHANAKVKCESCHKADKKYSEAPSICNECHKKGDKHKGMMGSDCERCHSEKNWKKLAFDHDKTNYKLSGQHIDVKCVKCHLNDKLKDTPKSCDSCHKKDDKHKGSLGTKCEICHSETSWKESLFDHDKRSTYPLLFKHRQVKCLNCHADNKYKETPKLCDSCHKKDDKHKGNFGTKCEDCHIERDWKEILFDHDRRTRVILQGKHKEAKCAGCHNSGRLTDKLPTLCIYCHEKDDKHKRNFGPMCDTCHFEKNWKETIFDHYANTNYRLVGKHQWLKCVSCHKGRMYDNDWFRSDCYYCHEKDDVHKGADGKKCETCHIEALWTKIIGNPREQRPVN